MGTILLSALIIFKGKGQGIISEEGIAVIQEQHFCYSFRIHEPVDVVEIVPWIHYNYLVVVLGQERYEAVGIGIFNYEQSFL